MCYDCGIAMRFLEVDAVALRWRNCCQFVNVEEQATSVELKWKPMAMTFMSCLENILADEIWDFIRSWFTERTSRSQRLVIEAMRKVTAYRWFECHVIVFSTSTMTVTNELVTWSVPMSSRHTYAHLQIVNIPSKEKLGLTSSPTDH